MVELLGVVMPDIVAFFLIGELAVFAVIVAAFVLARLHRGRHHHYVMLAAFLVDMVVFKPLMTARAFSGVWGEYPWSGTSILPHMVLDSLALVAGLGAIFLGFRYRVKKDANMFMPPEGKMHRWLGRAFIVLWTITLLGGLRIFMDAYVP